MEEAKDLSTRLGGPIVHEFQQGHVLRNDKGLRSDEESYSLFMFCGPSKSRIFDSGNSYSRAGVFTGPREWAIDEAAKKINTGEYDPVEDEWRFPEDNVPYKRSLLPEIEREIIQTMLDTWIENEMPMPGNISYQDIIDLMRKLEVDPSGIEARCRASGHG